MSGQLFIMRIPWSEPYYNQAVSLGRSILAENGNMVMGQLVMNTLSHRVSGQVKTEPGGLIRKGIPGEIKFKVPPLIGGWPHVGAAELCWGFTQIKRLYFIKIALEEHCECDYWCHHKRLKSIVGFLDLKKVVIKKPVESLSDLRTISVIIPRRASELKKLIEYKRKKSTKMPRLSSYVHTVFHCHAYILKETVSESKCNGYVK